MDKFFLILRVLRCERDHKAALCSQKAPTTFHSAADVYSTKYMRYLTPYAYKFVEKQLHLRKQVVIVMIAVTLKCMKSKWGSRPPIFSKMLQSINVAAAYGYQ